MNGWEIVWPEAIGRASSTYARWAKLGPPNPSPGPRARAAGRAVDLPAAALAPRFAALLADLSVDLRRLGLGHRLAALFPDAGIKLGAILIAPRAPAAATGLVHRHLLSHHHPPPS